MIAITTFFSSAAPTDGPMDWKLDSLNDGHWALSAVMSAWCAGSPMASKRARNDSLPLCVLMSAFVI